jgi:hypothetical protein
MDAATDPGQYFPHDVQRRLLQERIYDLDVVPRSKRSSAIANRNNWRGPGAPQSDGSEAGRPVATTKPPVVTSQLIRERVAEIRVNQAMVFGDHGRPSCLDDLLPSN